VLGRSRILESTRTNIYLEARRKTKKLIYNTLKRGIMIMISEGSEVLIECFGRLVDLMIRKKMRGEI
jgi:hypothetical protein